MKKIEKKTPINDIAYHTIKVADTSNECWSCEDCRVMFEKDDTILQKCKNGVLDYHACPFILTKFMRSPVQCRNRIYGGSKMWYESNYKINPTV